MTAQEIQQRMAAIRTHMSDDVQEIRDSSETMLDWRYYFKRYPWAMTSAAAVAGYLLVPRRLQVVRPDPRTLAKLAKKEQLVVKQESETKPQKGLMAVGAGLLANALLRAGTVYAGQQAGKILEKMSGTRGPGDGEPNGEYPLR